MKGRKTGKISKRTSILLLALLFVLIVPAVIFTFFKFEMGLYDNNSVIGSISLGIDLKGGVYVVLEPELDLEDGEEATEEDYKQIEESIDGTISIIQSRLFAKGYTEAVVVRQSALGDSGVTRIRVEIPDVDDPDEVFNIIGEQAVLEFRTGVSTDIAIGGTADGTETDLKGEHVTKAQAVYDSTGSPVVSLEFDSEGTAIFAELTASVGSRIAIVVDGILISHPEVESTITNGQAIINGMASYDEAENLAVQISSGALPLTFTEVSPKVISATLGEEALELSLLAGAIGLALVFIFMGIYYKGFGIIADISLFIYILIVIFLLAVLPWVQLTIQGIAGIILSIGMAVDANIIVFERIKDEYKGGKNIESSVKIGFNKATSAIIDANITTIIAASVLWAFGTGTIQGFGVTLFIGIVVSLFTSLVVTRFLTKLFLPLTKSEKFYKLVRESSDEEESVVDKKDNKKVKAVEVGTNE